MCVLCYKWRQEWDKNLYSPHEVHTSYVLFTYDQIVYSQYEWLPVRMIPRKNDSTLRIYLRSSSVNKLMTWSRIDYLSTLRADDLFPVRISILLSHGWPLSERMTCSQTESLFSVRSMYFVRRIEIFIPLLSTLITQYTHFLVFLLKKKVICRRERVRL